ncbi:MAG: hypothetical protein GY756_11730 [bacterium]|nr:hypothetical protein [bacterium]
MFYVDEGHYNNLKQFMFRNSLGAMDFISLKGIGESQMKIARKTGFIDNAETIYNSEFQQINKVNSGWLNTSYKNAQTAKQYVIELINSKEAYEVKESNLLKISPSAKKITVSEDDEFLQSFTFEYKYVHTEINFSELISPPVSLVFPEYLHMAFDIFGGSFFSPGLKFKWSDNITLNINWGDGTATEQFTNDTEIVHTYNTGQGRYYAQVWATAGSFEKIEEFTADNCEMSELRGIEKLAGLTLIDLRYNLLTGDIILNNKPYLEKAYFAENDISTIDLSNNPLFTGDRTQSDGFFANNENLESINISGCTSFAYLNAGGMKLHTLNINGCSSMKKIEVCVNQLSSIDITQCPELNEIVCDDNQIEILDFSNGQNIIGIYAGGNKLKNLINLNNCELIEALSLSYNELEGDFVFTNKSSLRSFEIGYNNVSSVDVSNNNLNHHSISNCPNLVSFKADNNNCDEIQVANCPKLEIFSANNNVMTGVSDLYFTSVKYIDLSYNNISNIDDLNIASGLDHINFSNNQITDISSLSYRDDIKYADFSHNNISSIPSRSFFGSFEYVNFNNNNITGSVNISERSNKLKEAYFGYNHITSIDLTDCIELTHLDVQRNNLASLDIHLCPELVELYCNDNQIDYLDFYLDKLVYANAENNNLMYPLYYNNLHSIETLLLANNDLPGNFALTNAFKLKRISLADNNFSAINIWNAPLFDDSVNAENHFIDNPNLETLNIKGCSSYTKLIADNMSIHTLTFTACIGIKTLRVSNNNLASVDIVLLPYLELLSCFANQIKTLNFTNGQNITSVEASNNDLESLTNANYLDSINEIILSDNPNLLGDLIITNKNILESLEANNTGLDSIMLANNRLVAFSISNCPNLVILDLSNNIIDELRISNCPNLLTLIANDNNLPDINQVSNTDTLEYVDIKNNAVTEIDLFNFPELRTFHCENNEITELNFGRTQKLITLTAANNQISNILNEYFLYAINFLDLSNNELTGSLVLNYKHNLLTVLLNGNTFNSVDLSNNSSLLNFKGDLGLYSLNLSNCSSMQELYVSGLHLETLIIDNCNSLVRIEAGPNGIGAVNFPAAPFTYINLYNNNMSQSEVDDNLISMNNAGISDCEIIIDGDNDAPRSSEDAINELRSRGCTVEVNS